MKRPFKIRYIVFAAIAFLAMVAVWFYTFLSSFIPTTAGLYATVLFMLSASTAVCVYRAVTRWKEIGSWRRAYAVASVAISSLLFAGFVLLTGSDERLAPKYLWAVWNIQRRGGHVQVEELRGQYVMGIDARLTGNR